MHFIDGEWRNSSNGNKREIFSPANATKLVTTVPEATIDDAHAAIAAARKAFDYGEFPNWTLEKRITLVQKVADLLERDAGKMAALESGDTGKRIVEAEYDVGDVIACFRHFANIAKQADNPQPRTKSALPVGPALPGPQFQALLSKAALELLFSNARRCLLLLRFDIYTY